MFLRACATAALGASLLHAQLAPGRAPVEAPAGAPAADSLEAVLVELGVHGDGSRTVHAFRHGDEAWLPVSELLSIADVAFRRTDAGEFTLTLASGRRVSIDAARSIVRVNGKRTAVADGALFARDGETYAASRALGLWLNIRFEIKWNELRVTALGGKELPAENRITRAASRFVTPLAAAPPPLLGTRLAPSRPLLDGFVVDYDVTMPFNAPLREAAYTFGTGVTVIGGALDAQFASDGAGTNSTQVSWTGVWRDNPLLTQVRLGDVPITGTRFLTVRGFALSNAPFVRPTYFGQATYGADLGPGYEVESYVGSQLVAVDTTRPDGRFALPLPVFYGSNPVDFVAYGPHDEPLKFSQLFQVFPQDFLPAGKIEYGLSAGKCEAFSECQYTGNADLRVGVTSRASIETGFELLQTDSTGRAGRPYFDFSLNPTNAIFISAQQLALASTTILARWEPSLDHSLTLTAGRFTSGDTVTQILTGQTVRDHYDLLYYVRPPFGGKNSYLTVDASRLDGSDGTQDRLRVSLGVQLPVGQLVPYVEFDGTHNGPSGPSSTSLAGVNVFVLPVRSLGPVVGEVLAYGALERTSQGTGTSSLTLVRQFGNRFRVELGGNWAGGTTPATYTLRVLSDLPQARVITTANAGGGPGASAGSNFVSGSIVADTHAGQVAFIPGPALQRAGVTGRVYLDANVNGKFDAGDTPIAGALVRVGSVYALTDSSGRYRVWDLVPFEPVSLAVDVSSLDSPLWAADVQRVVVEPWPNRLQEFDVAIVPGGVVEGTVVDGRKGNQPLAGVRVVLVESGTSRRMETTTFSDGGFSFLGVKPGRWSLAVDPRDAAALKGESPPTAVVVKAMENGDRVQGLQLVVGAAGARP
jgi:Carboxypeptidase regulatory-like domain